MGSFVLIYSLNFDQSQGRVYEAAKAISDKFSYPFEITLPFPSRHRKPPAYDSLRRWPPIRLRSLIRPKSSVPRSSDGRPGQKTGGKRASATYGVSASNTNYHPTGQSLRNSGGALFGFIAALVALGPSTRPSLSQFKTQAKTWS